MPLGTEVGLGAGHIVLDGDRPSPLPEKGAKPPNFRPMSVVAKRLDGIKMLLGTVLRVGPGHVVLDEDTAPLSQKGYSPQFWPMSIVADGWMDEDGIWYGGKLYLGPGHIEGIWTPI